MNTLKDHRLDPPCPPPRPASLAAAAVLAAFLLSGCGSSSDALAQTQPEPTDPAVQAAVDLFEAGRETFRHDTFGDERLWGDSLRLHEAIAGAANGGTGPGISPAQALALGLKVDQVRLPPALLADLADGRIDLTDPAVTVALLQLDAVVGVKGFFDDAGALTTMGITCALCHSTVDDAFAPGIGRRLDGWANRDLDVGQVIAAAPDLTAFTNLLGVGDAALRDVLRSWGPGKFDAHVILDGITQRPDGQPAAVLIPPAFGLAGVNLATWTGWGSVTYWNAFVGHLEMGGRGTLWDPRLNDPVRFPVAAANGFGASHDPDDRLTGKLAGLHFYQLGLQPPPPPPGSFDPAMASMGRETFMGTGDCARCHVPPLFTEPGYNLRTPAEMGIDAFQADRSPTGEYRTAPLRGLWTHEKGGYFHDGRFPTLDAVVDHYDTTFGLGLTAAEKGYLVEYLKSL